MRSWPNAAVDEPSRRLRSGGAELWCRAALNGDGLRIAAYVAAKTGARPWRMTTSDYLTAILDGAAPEAVVPEGDGLEIGPAPGRLTDVPWDRGLDTALRAHRIAVPKERVADPSSTTWRWACLQTVHRPTHEASPQRSDPTGRGG